MGQMYYLEYRKCCKGWDTIFVTSCVSSFFISIEKRKGVDKLWCQYIDIQWSTMHNRVFALSSISMYNTK